MYTLIIKIINFLKMIFIFLALHNIEINQKNIVFFENDNKSYTMVDLYLIIDV